jgi:hypothetical protein
MGNKLVRGILAGAAIFCFFAISQAQAQDAKFDPHDLNGVWVTKRPAPPPNADGAAGGQAPAAQQQGGNQNTNHPPFTAWAQPRFDASIPSGGPRDIIGKENDPTLKCDPDGFPKILNSPEPFEIVIAARRMFMFFEKDHIWREIWLDGRALPKDPDPTWNGTSVGHWEGNTLVVESNGFNDGTWLDYQGDPHSDQMHLTERYTKISPDTMTIDVTVNDPKAYTAPWVFKTRTYALHKDWEIHEWYCTQDESKTYDEQIRVPSGQPGSTAK